MRNTSTSVLTVPKVEKVYVGVVGQKYILRQLAAVKTVGRAEPGPSNPQE